MSKLSTTNVDTSRRKFLIGGAWMAFAASAPVAAMGSTVVEVAGCHAIYMSQPNAVAAFIERAARGK